MHPEQLEELLRNNPSVDARELEEVRKIIQSNRAAGVRRSSYSIAPRAESHARYGFRAEVQELK